MATIKFWNGTAWELAIVGKQGPVGPTGPTGPAGQASLQRFRYVATGGQTSVSGTDANGNTLAYTPGLEEVFINGAAQVRGQDYTATNGTSITGIGALLANDVVEVYAWGVFNVANTIPNTLVDAKGDILAGTGADSVGRLAVGANNTVLTADSSTATGLKWAAPSAGPTGWSLLNTGGTALTGADTITISGISAKQLLILVDDASAVNTFADFRLRFNNDSAGNYWAYGIYNVLASTYAAGNFDGYQSAGFDTRVSFAQMGNTVTSKVSGYCFVDLADTTGFKRYETASSGDGTGGATSFNQYTLSGIWRGTAAITSISLVSTGGNFDNGTIYVYGAN